MKKLNLTDVYHYVEQHIGAFHTKRLDKLGNLRLKAVLYRKNPYLFKAKHTMTSETLVKGIVDAYLSSQEETIFGDFLEGIAVFVCGKVFGGYKPHTTDLEGVDLVFERDGNVYVVEIKSGPNWGNSSQIKKMTQNFRAAQKALQKRHPHRAIVPVNGCSYGRDARPHKNRNDGSQYWKLCGQDFWSFISGNDDLYTEIIEPLGHQAKERNEDFEEAYAKVINRFTLRFAEEFCSRGGVINWGKIVRLISERDKKSPLRRDSVLQ
jgi:hypothetical protein